MNPTVETNRTPEPHSTPTAWVLCPDERLYRFFEIELAHLGLRAIPEPSEALPAPCLLVADTDAHPLDGLTAAAERYACPLLGFGYKTADIPDGCGCFLRRPFALASLESTLRQLSAEAVSTASPLAQAGGTQARGMGGHGDAAATPVMDASTATVSVGDFRVSLTPTEWAILARLYDRRGEAVSREELSALLGANATNSVEVYICRLRRKIEKPLGRRLIRTVRGCGYRVE